jgi:sugar phosphate isomerase/epimerase
MAYAAAELGFDGVDLTVRPEGHVLPERVEQDLPKAYDAIKKAGINLYSIVTAITDPNDPSTEKILKTASTLGVRFYRMGWFNYDDKISIEENLQLISEKLKRLEALNTKYNIQAVYQNHSGRYFSAPIWDLAQALKMANVQTIGSQYDIYHATVEGMNAWVYGLKLMKPFIKMINIKDFQWEKKNGKWITEGVPLGSGAVEWKNYFALLKEYQLKVPISLHCEYPLGGAEGGARTLTIPKEQVLNSMRKDLLFLKQGLREAGLIA